MSDFESENSCLSRNSDTHQMHQTHGNMDFHENTDSENDTEIIESLFTPYTDEPIASLCIRLCRNRISDYAATEYDNEDPD